MTDDASLSWVRPGPPGAWRKSSFSYAMGDCVEVRCLGIAGVEVRDSKNPDGPVLSLTAGQWQAFLAGARGGAFGRLGA